MGDQGVRHSSLGSHRRRLHDWNDTAFAGADSVPHQLLVRQEGFGQVDYVLDVVQILALGRVATSRRLFEAFDGRTPEENFGFQQTSSRSGLFSICYSGRRSLY